MDEKGIVTFPRPAQGRIPNFKGSEKAAEKVSKLKVWQGADVLKANPDSPQQPLRRMALEEGKVVYMAVPRLRSIRCFVKLDSRTLIQEPRKVSTIRGAMKYGVSVHPREMRRVDLMVVGSVAVNFEGKRVGKGGGYSDLEYAIGREHGVVEEETPVLTTVHPVQLVDYEIPTASHDVPVDIIVTNNRIIEVERKIPKPKGIEWGILDEDTISSIPVLSSLRAFSRKAVKLD